MSKKQKKISAAVFVCIMVVLLAAIVLTGSPQGKTESISEVMRDAVLHETGKMNFFGIKAVNPGLISAFILTVVLLLAAACIRIFVIRVVTCKKDSAV